MTTPVLPERILTYIRARDENECRRLKTGCLHTCDTIELYLTVDQLNTMVRDPACPDNWICCCTNCTET